MVSILWSFIILSEKARMDNHNLAYENMGSIGTHLQSKNRFIYVKKQSSNGSQSQKVLVNPRFKAGNKVFLNPNFQRGSRPSIHINPHLKKGFIPVEINDVPSSKHGTQLSLSGNIHINPNVKHIQVPLIPQTVHVNPNFSHLTNNTLEYVPTQEVKENIPSVSINKAVVLTNTKLIRAPTNITLNTVKFKRRNSVKTKYKIVKSGISPKPKVKTSSENRIVNGDNKQKSRFKIDYRTVKSISVVKSPKKYINSKLVTPKNVFIKKISPSKVHNRFSLVNNYNVVLYRKSRNSLRKINISGLNSTTNTQGLLTPKNVKSCTKVIFSTKSPEGDKRIVRKFKLVRKHNIKKAKENNVSPKKLRKCNIPCTSYRKYGLCKAKENGKCFLKHDRDQIALCTRFLQGACLKEHCLLSHNVSPEKMPTCKYYLEGSCSKEKCPYLHVKISPKAEVCRDFIEGFCKKAAECEKRHQYLCPDYEKYGKCLKQRCPYPHGKMVRTYLINKNKFAKKSSDEKINSKKIVHKRTGNSKGIVDMDQSNEQNLEKRRYYAEANTSVASAAKCPEHSLQNDLKSFVGLQSRPKLGNLPSFIPLGDL